MSTEKSSLPSNPGLVDLPEPFTDDRGWIQPLADTEFKSAVLIKSNKGSVRANHYHKTDWHYVYVLEGMIEYHARKTGSSDIPDMVKVGPQQMVFTGPLEDHAMVFAEDTLFLVLGRNSRLQEIYEADVVRIDPIHALGKGT